MSRVGPALIHGDAGRGVVAVENFEAVETIVAMMAIGTRILHGKPALSARQSGRWADGRGEHLDIRGTVTIGSLAPGISRHNGWCVEPCANRHRGGRHRRTESL